MLLWYVNVVRTAHVLYSCDTSAQFKQEEKFVLRNLRQLCLSWSQNSDLVTTSLVTYYCVVINMVTSSILQAMNSIIVLSASISLKIGLSGLAGQRSIDLVTISLVTKNYLATNLANLFKFHIWFL